MFTVQCLDIDIDFKKYIYNAVLYSNYNSDEEWSIFQQELKSGLFF